MRVAMVVMPFAASDRPSLAAGLLQALLLERGIECESKYFNVTLRGLLGRKAYEKLSDFSQTNVLAGDWVFSQLYFGEAFSSWETYRRKVLDLLGVGGEYRRAIEELRRIAPLFLRLVFEACDWSRFDLVGFTSTFEQTMPSLCLAKEIRERHPQVKIAFGGANFEGPMGKPYLDLFPEIDFVATGEADVSFPQLCENLAHGIPAVPRGILHRNEGRTPEPSTPPVGPTSLDDLPIPHYDDFFYVHSRTCPEEGTIVPLETSRGCWWGQKQHCTFCGLNGEAMTFRRKDWRRAARETAALEERYRPSGLLFTDNILAMDYFKTLLPHWIATRSRTPKSFEIKANLNREQVVMLREAGILNVQPGIESFWDGTLELMRKGVSSAQNVALLRWCQELGIVANWNLLFNFPGEDLESYPKTYEVIQKISHLNAPGACAPIRIDRFSPNFEKWEEQGFREIRPQCTYRHILPFDEERLREAAYFFEYEHEHSSRIRELTAEIIRFGKLWRDRCEVPGRREDTFAVRRHLDGGWVLVDRRFNRPSASWRLDPVEILLLGLCDAPLPRAALPRQAARFWNGSERLLLEACEALLEREALIEMGPRVVTVPLLSDELRSVLATSRKEGDCE